MLTSDICIVGIDPDTVCPTAVVTRSANSPPEVFKFPLLSNGNHVAGCGVAFHDIGAFLWELVQEEGDVVAYLEHPVLGQGGPGPTISQAQIGGAIMAAACEYGVPLSMVNNQSWKKRICGNGNINKAEVTLRMQKIWPACYYLASKGRLDQNIIDAGAINLFGRQAYELRQRILARRARSTK